jgi:hypothetical protein
MLDVSVLFDVNPNVTLSIGSYGVITGERGGLITIDSVRAIHAHNFFKHPAPTILVIILTNKQTNKQLIDWA